MTLRTLEEPPKRDDTNMKHLEESYTHIYTQTFERDKQVCLNIKDHETDGPQDQQPTQPTADKTDTVQTF